MLNALSKMFQFIDVNILLVIIFGDKLHTSTIIKELVAHYLKFCNKAYYMLMLSRCSLDSGIMQIVLRGSCMHVSDTHCFLHPINKFVCKYKIYYD